MELLQGVDAECNLKRVTWGVTTRRARSRYSRLPTQSSYWDKEYSTPAREHCEGR